MTFTGMGPDAPSPRLEPNCQCDCHRQPGVVHVAACCQAKAPSGDVVTLAALPEVQALIAAAYDDAHDAVHYECWTDGDGGSATETLLAEQSTTSLALRAIRNRTPADAIAAREACDAQMRAEGRVAGLREAAEIVSRACWRHEAEAIAAWNRRAALPARWVGVKPLVWEPSVIGKPWHSAKAPWGWYYAQWDDETQAWFASLEMGEVEAPVILSPSDVPTIDAAKAAAQADYEARILSALEPDHAREARDAQMRAEGRVAGLREAAEIAGLNAWKHAGEDDYSRGMDAGAAHQVKVCCDAIRALADKIEGEGDE